MTFTSVHFLIFFPLCAAACWAAPARHRWMILLAASALFYMSIAPAYYLLASATALSTYVFTMLMKREEQEKRRKTLLLAAISVILLPLVFFKYVGPHAGLMLPVGISFYTFMAIGYAIDIYREELEPETNPAMLLLFLTFFPLILSGPIERARRMLPQFRHTRAIDYDGIAAGLKMMLWGYFMKLVVADRVGLFVDAVYEDIPGQNGNSILCAVLLYPFQEYADFGGYSLIAIGAARTMGIDVMENFRRPFFATSMTEFWRRWHISLISWLTDYVFMPLSFALRKHRMAGLIASILVTFLLSGIWHGATLAFLVWGLLQGSFLSLESLARRQRTRVETTFHLTGRVWYIVLCCLGTYVLFAASEVFTRAATFGDALMVFERIVASRGRVYLNASTLLFSYLGLTLVFLKDLMDEYWPGRARLMEHPQIGVRYSSYLLLAVTIMLLGVFKGSRFIYFQF